MCKTEKRLEKKRNTNLLALSLCLSLGKTNLWKGVSVCETEREREREKLCLSLSICCVFPDQKNRKQMAIRHLFAIFVINFDFIKLLNRLPIENN